MMAHVENKNRARPGRAERGKGTLWSPGQFARSLGQDARNGRLERDTDRAMREAHPLLARAEMVKLEARFHPPDRRTGTYIIVGHVTWPEPPAPSIPRVEPSPLLALASAPATLLATLRHLVRAKARSLGELESMRNEYWSFVRIPALASSPGAEGA